MGPTDLKISNFCSKNSPKQGVFSHMKESKLKFSPVGANHGCASSVAKTLHRSPKGDSNSAVKNFAGHRGPMILLPALYFSLADCSEKIKTSLYFHSNLSLFLSKVNVKRGGANNKKSLKRAPYSAWPPQKIFPTTPLYILFNFQVN